MPVDGRGAHHRPRGPRTTASGRTRHTQDPREWRRFGARIRELTGGDDPDIVFEHPGRETFGASVFVARKGGTIVTCASTSGFLHEYDNRYLWMSLKRIIGSHFANYREAWEANRLIAQGSGPSHPEQDLPTGRDRAGGVRGSPQSAPGQGRGTLLVTGGGARCARSARCATGTSRPSTGSEARKVERVRGGSSRLERGP